MRQRFFARAIFLSRHLDTVYRYCVRAREEAVLCLAGDRTLQQFNDLTYDSMAAYVTDAEGFRGHLYNVEEEIVARYFPKPHARVLVGGAGGGREALELQARGYDVVAFEIAQGLVEAFRKRAGDAITVYRGKYEDLWSTATPPDGHLPRAGELGRFDVVLLGGSFSHVIRAADRTRLLATCKGLLTERGIVVLSYRSRTAAAASAGRGLKQRLRRAVERRKAALGRTPGDRFFFGTGFIHEFAEGEIEALVAAAGLRVEFSSRESASRGIRHGYPYIVLSAPM